MKQIPIDKYETALEDGIIKYCAVKGKTKYPMPGAYKEMYDNEHLAIGERTLEMPELFDIPATHYIPLRTKL